MRPHRWRMILTTKTRNKRTPRTTRSCCSRCVTWPPIRRAPRASCASGFTRAERMSEHLTGLRKSAIVLLSIGSQQAEEVLRCVGDDVAGDLRREMQSALIATPTARALALKAFVD